MSHCGCGSPNTERMSTSYTRSQDEQRGIISTPDGYDIAPRRVCGMQEKEENSMGITDDECYKQLREAILRREFQPNERLIEMDLAQSLGAGRAAIRTALARLEQEGLVQRERYRGARVRLVSETE